MKKIILAGQYVHDLKARFTYSDIDMKKVIIAKNLDIMMQEVREQAEVYIYVITCLSDSMKFMNRIPAKK